MEIILTTSEIRAILQGCQQTLRLVQSTTEYRLIQQLKSKLAELEQQHQDYVRSQQDLISAIAEICISSVQEIEALRILIYKGEAECRRYLRSLLVNQRKAS